MSPERRAVFFDRDGTLMEEEDYCSDPAQVRAIPGAAAALTRLRESGWLNIVITNQSGIGRGYFTMADYEKVNAELFRQLDHGIDATYYCPDHPDKPSTRRKPGIGMIEEAVADHGIAIDRSWMVGDKNIDIAAGKTSGCRTILVLTGYGKNHQGSGADFIARDVVEAADIILKNS